MIIIKILTTMILMWKIYKAKQQRKKGDVKLKYIKNKTDLYKKKINQNRY
jgi:hypothetical protein